MWFAINKNFIHTLTHRGNISCIYVVFSNFYSVIFNYLYTYVLKSVVKLLTKIQALVNTSSIPEIKTCCRNMLQTIISATSSASSLTNVLKFMFKALDSVQRKRWKRPHGTPVQRRDQYEDMTPAFRRWIILIMRISGSGSSPLESISRSRYFFSSSSVLYQLGRYLVVGMERSSGATLYGISRGD